MDTTYVVRVWERQHLSQESALMGKVPLMADKEERLEGGCAANLP
jgi:hypothetical protein